MTDSLMHFRQFLDIEPAYQLIDTDSVFSGIDVSFYRFSLLVRGVILICQQKFKTNSDMSTALL